MDDRFDLLADLHIDGERQGPGSDEATRRAIALAGLEGASDLTIADVGCGTGASTLVLAHDLDAHIVAVDFLPAFLGRLDDAARRSGLADRITTVAESMDELSFAEGSLDVIWSEGALDNIGFEQVLVPMNNRCTHAPEHQWWSGLSFRPASVSMLWIAAE